MTIDKFNWVCIYPEIFLLIMACLITLVDAICSGKQRIYTYALSLLTLGTLSVWQARYALEGTTLYGFGGMVVSDPMGHWLQCFASVAVLVTLIYGRRYATERDMLQRGGELLSLSLFALLGIFIMINGHNLLVIYLGLELLTLSSYALVALRRDHSLAIEASMKYFVLGALASGFLLYGLSMMYGATGTLDLAEIAKAIASRQVNHQVLVFGLVFIVTGLAFKLGAVPFHMWVPDVYQGSPTAVTLLIAAAPKLAAFAITLRLLVMGLFPLALDWQQMLVLLAVASLLIGNLAAIAQSNLKRMLAFSTIAQVGFLLLGLLAGVTGANQINTESAYSAAMFYVITYVLTTLLTFGVILTLAQQGFESEDITDLAGLNQRSPFLAAVMALAMFSLAGIPPVVGFYAKLSVLQALMASQDLMHIGLAIFAVLMSLIGAFYYLRVVKLMYFDPPSTLLAGPVTIACEVKPVLALNGSLILLLGLLPSGLITLCTQAISALMKSV